MAPHLANFEPYLSWVKQYPLNASITFTVLGFALLGFAYYILKKAVTPSKISRANNKRKSKGPSLPPKIKLSELMRGDAGKEKQYLTALHKEGFAILTLDDDNLTEAMKNYFAEGREFFSMPFEEKDQLETIEKIETTVRKANRGYLHVKDREGTDIKEYLKLSLVDPDSAFPSTPASLKDSFHELYHGSIG